MNVRMTSVMTSIDLLNIDDRVLYGLNLQAATVV